MVKNLIKKMSAVDNQKKILLSAFLILGSLCAVMAIFKPTEEQPTSFAPPAASADTFIPNGLTLVYVELTNAEFLDSLLGDVGGVVDLYQVTEDKKARSTKVGSKLKLIRAPLNPQLWAVVVRDADQERILKFPGPFFAVVQNPQARGQKLTTSPTKSQVKIEYQN